MKRLIILSGIAIVLLSSTATSIAQKSKTFEGSVVYSITYPGSDFDANTMAMLPSTMTTKVMGKMKMVEMLSGMSNQREITNAEDMTRIALIEVMGQKFAIKTSKEDIEKENAEKPEPVVEYLDETKEIAEYTCKKAIIKYTDEKGKEQSIEAFFTEDINVEGIIFEGEYRNLKGFPMEYSVKSDRVNMTFTATEVNEGGVKKKEFAIPDDYKFVTEDELKSMFGG